MATWTNTTKNSTSWSNTSKDSTVWTNSAKELVGAVYADAGLHIGLGTFNYAGTEILVAGHEQSWTNVIKT